MRRVLCTLLSLCLFLALGACDSGHPQYDGPDASEGITPSSTDEPGSVVTLPVSITEGPVADTSEPLTREQVENKENLWMLQGFSSTVGSFYLCYGYPTFYPVCEETLDALRELLLENNEDHPELQFDTYSIEPCIWGYGVRVVEPLDYWGNPYYIWFEVEPQNDTTPRVTVVSAGSDGKLSYKGLGADYSDGGFGDDVILALTLMT